MYVSPTVMECDLDKCYWNFHYTGKQSGQTSSLENKSDHCRSVSNQKWVGTDSKYGRCKIEKIKVM